MCTSSISAEAMKKNYINNALVSVQFNLVRHWGFEGHAKATVVKTIVRSLRTTIYYS